MIGFETNLKTKPTDPRIANPTAVERAVFLITLRLGSWGIQNRARDLLTSGITSSQKAAEQDFETA